MTALKKKSSKKWVLKNPNLTNNHRKQKSPIVLENEYFVVRQEHSDFKKAPGVDRWFLISKRHIGLMGLNPEIEGPALLSIEQEAYAKFGIKGCSIHREGPKEHTASGLRDDHFFKILVKTTPGFPYKETLVKDLTGENLQRLDERAESYQK
ncbi:MAG: hypothetical protein ACD_56C00106G0005 [uncultured bacterium]|nr:MAG: hypothetical protein ACD_56C00106G0005 [uncultured bacterium]